MNAIQGCEASDPLEPSTLESIRERIEELARGSQIDREDLDTLFEAMRTLGTAGVSKMYLETLIDICVLAGHFGACPGHPLGAFTVSTASLFGDKILLLRALRSSANVVARSPSGELVIYSEALALARELRDSEAEFKICLNMIVCLVSLGQFGAAERIGRYAASLRGISDQLRPFLLSNLASLALLSDSPVKTKREIAKSIADLNLVQETHESAVIDVNRRRLRFALNANAAMLCANLGDIETGRQYLRTADELTAGDASPVFAIVREIAAAELALAEGQTEDGVERMSHARDLARENWGEMFYAASVSVVYAHEAAGRPDMALAVLRELIDYTQSQQEEVLRCDEVLRTLQPFENQAPADEDYRQLLGRAAQLEREVAQRWQSIVQACVNADLGAGHDLRRPFRMRELATLFCGFLRWSEDDIADVAIAAQLANIGMVGLPSTLILKANELSEGERILVQSHAEFGERLIEREGLQALALAAKVARHHHEQWAGGGYPDGLVGEKIPIAARVVALCDAFDAMTHRRPWRPRPLSRLEAVAEINRAAGSQFDPTLAARFVDFVESDLKEFEDLDSFLGRDGDENAYVRAREHIAAMVSHPINLAGA